VTTKEGKALGVIPGTAGSWWGDKQAVRQTTSNKETLTQTLYLERRLLFIILSLSNDN
jgi:hypothetical protein